MTIEAGVLALRITEQGADQVISKLDQIDKKAAALGKALFNQPSSTGVNGQVQQLSANFTQVASSSASATAAMEKQAATQAKVATSARAIGAESSALASAASGFASMATALGAIGITLSAGAILSGLVGLVREAIDAGDNLHDLAMRTGVSTQNLSVFAQVAAKSGADTGTLTVGFRNLSREVEKARGGNKDAIASFAALGLTVADFAGLSLDQIFVKIANAQEQFADGAGKTAAMVQIFGRAGDALIPTLHELADGGFERAKERAEGLGGVISEQFANKADAFNDQLEDLHMSLLGLGMVIADPLLPFLARMADLFTTLIVKAQGFGNAVENMLIRTPLGPLIGLLNSALPTKFTPMGPTMAQLTSGRTKLDVPTITKGGESAEDKARARALAKAMGLDEASILGIGLTDHGPAGPMMAPTVGVDSKGNMKGVKGNAVELLKQADAQFDALAEKITAKKEMIRGLMTEAGMIVGSAFGDAFTAAFKEGGNFFEAFGKSLLSGLGNIIMQLGEQMIAYAAIITPLTGILGPFSAIAGGGPMTLAAGIALTALGAAMGAAGGGGKGGSSGGGSSRGGTNQQQDNTFAMQFDPDGKLRKRAGPSVIPSSRALTNAAMPDARPAVQIGVLNALHPDDPRWQRELAATVKNAQGRGLLKAG